ncbi:MAG: (2Fe-2S) ferredoxin domain-containing protein [Deltaproteobacteria bacterium]|nr:(2Fe-2S) ferredoxin domain-containing protein [Deltaproteobacteria bacterium]
MSRINPLGSEVAAGFACKPETADPEKPIMFAAAQIFICDGERCRSCHSDDLAGKVRALVKAMGCDKGDDRIKVTRCGCNGACRFRVFACVYQNGNARSYNRATSFSAWKRVHEWSDGQWMELIASLREGRPPESLREFRVEDKVYYG